MARQVVKVVSLQTFQSYLVAKGAQLQPDGTYKTRDKLLIKGVPAGPELVKMIVTTCAC